MVKLSKVFLVLSFSLFLLPARADSPITSTEFFTVYENESIVQIAKGSSGLLTEKLMQYLADATQPVDVKMAIINALSWYPDGKTNAQTFVDYLVKNTDYKNLEAIQRQAPADIILALAYFKAQEQRHNPEEAFLYAQLAKAKRPKSYTVQLISGIIKAQLMFNVSWCESFHATDSVRQNAANLTMDMRAGASDAIFGYMELYQPFCK